MTTAHRATWRAARGGDNEEGSFILHVPSASVSAKAAPTERILKSREASTTTREELRARLEQREGAEADEDALEKQVTVSEKRLKLSKGSEDVDVEEKEPDDRGGGEEDNSESGSESDTDSEDDAAELQAELERIRAERAKTAAAAREAAAEAEAALAEAQAAKGNPLLGDLSASANIAESVATGSTAGFAVKRKWNEDVVFRNQARGERRVEQRFVNDTIRNDFHKRFLKRYMR